MVAVAVVKTKRSDGAVKTLAQGLSQPASPLHTSNVPRKAQPKASCLLPPHHAQSLVEVSGFRVAFQDECYHEIKSCGNEQTIGGLCRDSIGGCEDGDLVKKNSLVLFLMLLVCLFTRWYKCMSHRLLDNN